MSRARDLSKLGNPNVIKADTANNVGFGTQTPLDPANSGNTNIVSAGIVTAAKFFGDGSGLDGVASAGLGTAVDDTKDSIGQNIYYTNQELSIYENTTVNAPATSDVAYTQYSQVTVEDGKELIVADGDTFIPDVLGIGTGLQAVAAGAGNGLFGTVYVDNIENVAGRGGPNLPLGMTVSGIATFSGNVSIGGTLTYEDVTNVDSIGVVTARSGVDITSGGLDVTAGNIDISSGNVNILADNKYLKIGAGADLQFVHTGGETFITNSTGSLTHRSDIHKWENYAGGSEYLRLGSAGQIGIAGANYGTSGQVMTSQGASAAPQWADAGGGAWEVVQSTALSGSNTYLDFNGWSNSYQKYQLVFSDIYWTSEFRIYCRFYKDATSGNAGTLQTASQYKFGAISNTIQNSGNIQSNGNSGDYYQIGKGDYGYLWNGYLDFPMRTWTADATYTGSTCIGLTMRDYEVFPGDACFYDTNKGEFLTGIRLYFFNDAGNAAVSPTQGRFTILRMKYS